MLANNVDAISIPNSDLKKRKKDRYAVEKTITIAFHLNPEATNEGRVELQKTVRLIGPLFNLINYL